MSALSNYEISGGRKISSGKVREIFDVDDDHLMMVTTDRLSAFDVVMPDPIPDKGAVLNRISLWWFDKMKSVIKNHVVSSDINEYPAPFKGDIRLKDRSMLVIKARPLTIECIVRGYISGSGWKEYKEKGSISGIKLPAALKESDKLSEPIFTPSTKAEMGQHDENVSEEVAKNLVGTEIFNKVKEAALKIYKTAADEALKKGIIIADTKFEFGIRNGEVILIDEVLTRTPRASGRLTNTLREKPSRAMTNSLSAITLKRLTGGKRLPVRNFLKRSSRKLVKNISKHTRGLPD